MTSLLVHDCDILRIEDGKTQVDFHRNILIKDNRIERVLPADEMAFDFQGEVIEGSGLLAIPGLINTHAHVPMVLFRGLAEDVPIEAWFNDYIWPLESNLMAEDVYWGAMLGIAEMIEGGITCFADHYFYMDEVAKAVGESGIRANLAWGFFEHEGVEKLDIVCDFVRRWQGGANGRITTWLGPHAPYTCGPEFLKLCAARAKELNVGIHIHVSETAQQVELSLKQYQKTPVALLADSGVLEVPCIFGHCLYPQSQDVELLRSCQVGVAHAPKTYLKLAMGNVNLEKFLQAGIPVGLATDGVVSSNTLDIFEQMRLMALAQKDLSRDSTQFPLGKVLGIAFAGSARVLRMDKEFGEISPGRLADIVLVKQDGVHCFPRYDPAATLVYSNRASDVVTVICDGRVLMRDHRLLTIDKALVKKEVAQRLERLSRRSPGVRIATYPT